MNTTTTGTITNFASVTSGTNDPSTNNNSTSEQTTINALEADLSVSKSDAIDPVTVGEDVTYTITVTNNGPDAAESVALTDNLPGSVTFVNANPSQGSCSQSNGVLTCSLGNINNGANATVTVVVKTTTTGAIINNASVTSNTNDPNSSNNSTSEQTTVNDLTADLSITKSDAVDPVTVGDNVTYTVAVTNNGPHTAENVVMTDDLPNGVSFGFVTSSQGSCSEINGVVSCNLGNINNGNTVIVTITVNTTSDGVITNIASVTSTTNDPDNSNNSVSEQTTVFPTVQADLSVNKNDVVDPVTVGDSLTYTITVTNNGPETAKDVVLIDNLPGGLSFVSHTTTQGICGQSNGVVTCNIGTMNNGKTVTVTIVAKSTNTGNVTNTASVTSSTADPNSNNNSSSEQTVIKPLPGADLEISKIDLLDPVAEGANVTYTINVINNGPDIAENVLITDNLPNNVNYISSTSSQGSCIESNGIIACTVGNIENGGSVEVTVMVQSITSGLIINTVSVTSSTVDPDSNNNSTTEQTTVTSIPLADLSIQKIDMIDPVTIGDSIHYEITVTNNGPDEANNVVLTDQLPGEVEFVSVFSVVGTCSESAGLVTCSLGNIGNGSTVTATIVVKTTTIGTVINTSSVTTSTTDPNLNNNSETQQTLVSEIPEADLSVTKTDDADPVIVGENVTYTVVVANKGPDTAEDVVLTDNLPANVDVVSATSDQGSCSVSNGVVTCSLGSIISGSEVTATIVIKTAAVGEITNIANASSSTEDPNLNNIHIGRQIICQYHKLI